MFLSVKVIISRAALPGLLRQTLFCAITISGPLSASVRRCASQTVPRPYRYYRRSDRSERLHRKLLARRLSLSSGKDDFECFSTRCCCAAANISVLVRRRVLMSMSAAEALHKSQHSSQPASAHCFLFPATGHISSGWQAEMRCHQQLRRK